MDAGEGSPRAVLAINDRGLVLGNDGDCTWVIEGSADGKAYPAEDRLMWLLPLSHRALRLWRAAVK